MGGLQHLLIWSWAAASAAQQLPTCPPLPHPENVDANMVLQDDRVRAAIEEVDALFANASRHLPSGFVATVVLDQETAWVKGYGTRDVTKAGAPPPSGSDLLRVASISKVFTSLLMFLLRDAGVVNLDDTLEKWMKAFSVMDPYKTRDVVTLRNLASHTSGLQREFPFPCSDFTGAKRPKPKPYSGCTESEVMRQLSQKFLVSPPNTVFHYSNLGFGLLGRALGHALNDSDPLAYERAVKKYIFDPLGMENATFAWDSRFEDRYAVGVNMSGKPIKQAEGQTCGWGAPAGCVWASANDISQIMKLMFRRSVPAEDSQPGHVDGQTIAEFLLPRVLLRDGMEAIGTPMEMQYLGDELRLWAKGKQGELPGFRSSMSIVEELRLGVFSAALITDVEDHTVWTLPALRIIGPAVKAAMEDLQPKKSLPQAYERFLGNYVDDVSVEVDPQDSSQLILLLGNDAHPLALSEDLPLLGPNALKANPTAALDCRHLDDGSNLEIAYFSFDGGGDGKASSVEFMGQMYRRHQ